MNFAIIGFGGRGKTYAHFIKYYEREIVAVCDSNRDRLNEAAKYGVIEKNLFIDENEFFSKGKIADALVISTMDKLHYRQTIKALDLGYDILLEKPISVDKQECMEIEKKAKAKGRKVCVCHVLRYAPIYKALKDEADSGKYGEIVSVSMTENIGYYHFAHSYVRGNWRNEEISAPLILAKNCHDLDLICWLIDKKCKSVSSYGSLKYFTEKNAPKGSDAFCVDCRYSKECIYSAFNIYNNKEYEKAAGLAAHGNLGTTEKEITRALSDKTNLLSRCVFRCDNDICDNQIVNMLFDGDVTAQLKSIAFSETIDREFQVYMTKGMLRSVNGKIEYQILGGNKGVINVEKLIGGYAHHGGGDVMIVKEFIDYIERGIKTKSITDISLSVLSHKIGFAADLSQKSKGKLVEIDE